MRDSVDAFQNLLHIRGVIERLGNDDDIKLALQFQIFRRANVELAMWNPRLRRRDVFLGNVDADDVAIRQELKQMTAAATKLKHARIRRDQIAVIIAPRSCR